MAAVGPLVYCDTNVYARPFDDQTQAVIQAESNAFLEIISRTRDGDVRLLCSDIVDFEVANILEEGKRNKVRSYLDLCSEHVTSTDEVLQLGKKVQYDCHLRPRDALHVASAILGRARYFLSCDKKVTQMKRARCYRRLAKEYRAEYFSAVNPIRFTEKMQKEEIE